MSLKKPGGVSSLPKPYKGLWMRRTEAARATNAFRKAAARVPSKMEDLRTVVGYIDAPKGRGKSLMYGGTSLTEERPIIGPGGEKAANAVSAEHLVFHDAYSRKDYLILGVPLDPAMKEDFGATIVVGRTPDIRTGLVGQRILSRAAQVLGSRTAAEEWFSTKSPWLDNQAPATLVSTEEGTKQVENYLTKVDYGVYV